MSKRVSVVTGSNKGLGYEIVRGLAAKFDGDVVLTARNAALGAAARDALSKETGVDIKFHQLDINDDASVSALATFLKETYGGLDVLVNNAGMAYPMDSTVAFGEQAENTVATNYFGVRRTCDALFPLLRDGARVVNVSSLAGYLGHIPGEQHRRRLASDALTVADLDAAMREFVAAAKDGSFKEKQMVPSAYAMSKIGLSALSRVQQREVEARNDVAVNHVHPGIVQTDMTRGKGQISAEQGARSSLYAALLPPGTDVRGKFLWEDCREIDWVSGPLPEWKF